MIKSALQSSLTNDVKYRNLGASNVPSNEYLIETAIVTSPVSVIAFNNLAQYAGVYRHLQIVYSATVTADNWLTMSINNVTTGSLYRTQLLRGTNTAINVFTSGGEGNGIGYVGLIYSTASGGIIDILDPYVAGKNRVTRALTGNAIPAQFGAGVALSTGLYMSTDIVSSLELRVPPNNFAIGTRFSLYGVTA